MWEKLESGISCTKGGSVLNQAYKRSAGWVGLGWSMLLLADEVVAGCGPWEISLGGGRNELLAAVGWSQCHQLQVQRSRVN